MSPNQTHSEDASYPMISTFLYTRVTSARLDPGSEFGIPALGIDSCSTETKAVSDEGIRR